MMTSFLFVKGPLGAGCHQASQLGFGWILHESLPLPNHATSEPGPLFPDFHSTAESAVGGPPIPARALRFRRAIRTSAPGAIITERPDGCAPPVGEDEQNPGQGIRFQLLAAQGHHGVHAFPEIQGRNGQQNPLLRGDKQHLSPPVKALD
jgi:hypothetical protein